MKALIITYSQYVCNLLHTTKQKLNHKKLKVKTIQLIFLRLHNQSMIAMLGKLYDADAVTDLTYVTHLQFVYFLILWFLILNCKIFLDLLYYSYEMLPLEEQLEIAHQVGTTRSQILSNLIDLSLGTSFL